MNYTEDSVFRWKKEAIKKGADKGELFKFLGYDEKTKNLKLEDSSGNPRYIPESFLELDSKELAPIDINKYLKRFPCIRRICIPEYCTDMADDFSKEMSDQNRNARSWRTGLLGELIIHQYLISIGYGNIILGPDSTVYSINDRNKLKSHSIFLSSGDLFSRYNLSFEIKSRSITNEMTDEEDLLFVGLNPKLLDNNDGRIIGLVSIQNQDFPHEAFIHSIMFARNIIRDEFVIKNDNKLSISFKKVLDSFGEDNLVDPELIEVLNILNK
jgi:hypothetical protein